MKLSETSQYQTFLNNSDLLKFVKNKLDIDVTYTELKKDSMKYSKIIVKIVKPFDELPEIDIQPSEELQKFMYFQYLFGIHKTFIIESMMRYMVIDYDRQYSFFNNLARTSNLVSYFDYIKLKTDTIFDRSGIAGIFINKKILEEEFIAKITPEMIDIIYKNIPEDVLLNYININIANRSLMSNSISIYGTTPHIKLKKRGYNGDLFIFNMANFHGYIAPKRQIENLPILKNNQNSHDNINWILNNIKEKEFLQKKEKILNIENYKERMELFNVLLNSLLSIENNTFNLSMILDQLNDFISTDKIAFKKKISNYFNSQSITSAIVLLDYIFGELFNMASNNSLFNLFIYNYITTGKMDTIYKINFNHIDNILEILGKNNLNKYSRSPRLAGDDIFELINILIYDKSSLYAQSDLIAKIIIKNISKLFFGYQQDQQIPLHIEIQLSMFIITNLFLNANEKDKKRLQKVLIGIIEILTKSMSTPDFFNYIGLYITNSKIDPNVYDNINLYFKFIDVLYNILYYSPSDPVKYWSKTDYSRLEKTGLFKKYFISYTNGIARLKNKTFIYSKPANVLEKRSMSSLRKDIINKETIEINTFIIETLSQFYKITQQYDFHTDLDSISEMTNIDNYPDKFLFDDSDDSEKDNYNIDNYLTLIDYIQE